MTLNGENMKSRDFIQFQRVCKCEAHGWVGFCSRATASVVVAPFTHGVITTLGHFRNVTVSEEDQYINSDVFVMM